MKAGFYESDITAPVGMESPGSYGKVYIQQIHDALKVRAAVIRDGDERVALVGVDTCELHSARAIAEVRERVEKLCGIPGDRVLVAASHTHSGGPFAGFLPRDADGAPPDIRSLMLDYSPNADPVYYDWVVYQIVTAICEADRRAEDAVLSVGSGADSGAIFNRRFRMKNGRCYTHPGKGNPDIIEPAGPVDPEVSVLAAWTPGGNLLGAVVNYACHGTTFGGGVSADWIHYLNTTVRGGMDADVPVVFLPGAAGDVTQVDNSSLRVSEFGERWSREVGTRVGAEALKVLASADRGALSPVAARTRVLDIDRRLPTPERLAECKRIVETGIRDGRLDTEWTFAKEIVLLDYIAKQSPTVKLEVQAIQVGPAIFIANPAECFCQIGLDIKAQSAFPHTNVVSVANGLVGYIPTEDAFLPTGGGYETVLTAYSNLETSAAGKLVEASVALSRTFTPGAVPQTPQVDAPGAPWSYGVLGPDA